MNFTLAQFIMSYLFINPQEESIQLTDRLSGDQVECRDYTVNEALAAIPDAPSLIEVKLLSILTNLQSAGIKRIKGYVKGEDQITLVPSLDDFDLVVWIQYSSKYLKHVGQHCYPEIDEIKIERFEHNLPSEQENDQILRSSDFAIITILAKLFGYKYISAVRLDLVECYSGPVIKLAFED